MGLLLDKFKNRLSSHNYKLTKQREDVLKVFIENKNNHFSAEELFEEVKKINPDVGLATIYRSLELFSELGIIHELDFDKSYKRYELNIKDNHHHHLICLKCDKIIEFNDEVLEHFENSIENEYEFQVVSHRIKFYGLCQECINKDE
ncbi:MAG: Fur family transcriptional regulator [Halanaerobiaceae bacterium]